MVEAKSTSLKLLVFWLGLETTISTNNIKRNLHFIIAAGRTAKADSWRLIRFEQIKSMKNISQIIIWEAKSFRMYPFVSLRAGRSGV